MIDTPKPISSKKNKNKDKKTEAGSASVGTSVCSICRVYSLSVCAGHGFEEGGVSGNILDASCHMNQSAISVNKALSAVLEASVCWQSSREMDALYVFELRLPKVFLSLGLFEGLVKIVGKEALRLEEEAYLNFLYEAIQNELYRFKMELDADIGELEAAVCINRNDLEIRIPDRAQYEAFVLRLMDKNLIPTKLIYS